MVTVRRKFRLCLRPLQAYQSSYVTFHFECIKKYIYIKPPSCASLITHLYSPVCIQGSSSRGPQLLLVQCQFSLGCSLTATLSYLQQGALHSTASLLLTAGLSWALARICHNLWKHVEKLYLLHSTQRYCGKCISLLTSGHSMLASLQRGAVLAFAIAALASTATVYDHFLSQKDALKLWTPLTLCYAMLVAYIQGDGECK